MRKPFDLDYYKAHPDCKVETGRGEKVSIIKTDMKSDYPILAIIEYASGQEDCDIYTLEGKNSVTSSNNDLFIVTDEPKLTEFEKALDNVIRSYRCDSEKDENGLPLDYQGWIKKKAAELLSLAKEDALKDLPRWKKIKDNGTVTKMPYIDTNILGETMLYIGGDRGTSISALEKLPGFKEE